MRGEVPTIRPCVPTPRGDADGDTVQVYEYDVYGQPAASDPNHPNRFMFTGREFDKETGLYYYRARYYDPTIGRFLQTDPIGYADGMGLYVYCTNNPWNSVDPYGLYANAAADPNCKDVYVYGDYNDCCCPSFAAAHPEVCDPNYWDKARAAASGGGGGGGGGATGGGGCGGIGSDGGGSGSPPEGCSATDEGIDTQIKQCSTRVNTRVDNARKKTGKACRNLGYAVRGIAVLIGGPVAIGGFVLGGVTEDECRDLYNELIDDYERNALDYCKRMGKYCKGVLPGGPGDRPKWPYGGSDPWTMY